MTETVIGTCHVQVLKDDITSLDTDAFVFAARPDLTLGAGFGSAIAVRGGPAIQSELKALAPVDVGQAVVSSGGKLKAKLIIHAVTPRFQEADLEAKLSAATRNALAAAENHGVHRLALPPLGTGFYGVPVDLCARVMMTELRAHLAAGSGLRLVTVCVRDTHERAPFERALAEAAAGAGHTAAQTGGGR